MAREPLFAWEGTEYAFEEKSADWYWALGIIAVAAIIACVLFNNFLLGLVIAAGAGSLALQAAKHPRLHHFEITERGVQIDTKLYPYEDILSFSVLEYADPAFPPSLSLKTKQVLAPHLIIPIVGIDPMVIYEFFEAHIPEGRHEENVIDRVIELLRIG